MSSTHKLLTDDELFAEAERQLNVCNACRYCEGYCAVFPALERRTLLTKADMVHLSDLCHDCRACLYACMYAPPHEFGINPPQILAELRLRSLDEGSAGTALSLPRRLRGRVAGVAWFLVALLVMLVLAAITEGLGHLWASRSGATSPYVIISYPALVVVMALPFAATLVLTVVAGARYWRRTQGNLADLRNLTAWRAALGDAAQLRYLKGGGAGCQYPDERPSAVRRRLHAAMVYGLIACFVSTVAAGVSQDILGSNPPYPLVSVPVLFGLGGGVALVAGAAGLLVLGARSDPAAGDPRMQSRNARLLTGLIVVGASGLATLAFRTTEIYGPLLVVHLVAVAVAFGAAPYSKLVHGVYRLLALVAEHLERGGRGVELAVE